MCVCVCEIYIYIYRFMSEVKCVPGTHIFPRLPIQATVIVVLEALYPQAYVFLLYIYMHARAHS